ncbi:MAG: thiamine pyrophosphate-binding protein [Microcella sp.]|uniref:thiamine pyrophosphate-binding protein n=1 Tax=Microcella sp. TaxID=1913979 RepID=UPI00331487E9
MMDELGGTHAAKEARYFGSDVVVDFLQSKNIEYIALNPGASFRGLHDSIVNHGANSPEIILVPHEKVAVGIAHGFAKATGRMMGVALHDLVGLLHGTMGVYYAYVDRAPMVILGGAGPMDAARRRPWIDWIHTANVQNAAVREYTKWDDHPFSVAAIPESLERGWRIAGAHPQGPVYIALDADLQEEEVTGDRPRLRDHDSVPTQLSPDPHALESLADMLCAAARPVLIAGAVGRDPAMWTVLVELAELVGAAVVDTNIRHNFPNRHPLNLTGSDVVSEADLVVLLDVKDVGQHTGLLTKADRGGRLRSPAGAKIVDIGFGDIGISSWSVDYGGFYEADLRVTADTTAALPLLLDATRGRVSQEEAGHAQARHRRRAEFGRIHDDLRSRWSDVAQAPHLGEAMSTARLVHEVGQAIAPHDWILTAGTGNGWAPRLWDFDRHDRHVGRSLGTSTQIGISLGVALAYRGTGRLVVDLQPDGDLMFDASALWVASHHRIPMLVIMVNNRAYNNDWVHQKAMADERDTPRERTWIGITIEDPEPDFATLARSFGWHAAGPITEPDAIGAAVAEAIDHIQRTGMPALVDIVCSADD